jgi:hypothetical protein
MGCCVGKSTHHSLSPTSQGEQECGRVLKKLFPHHRFVKARPNFLIHQKTGRCLELDWYCADLKLAIEYNGEQHYRYLPRFHRSQKDFKEQQGRDRLKRRLCQKHGITLIVVPYTVKNLETYLKSKLRQYQ